MIKLIISYIIFIAFATMLLSSCIFLKESDKRYEAQIANSNALVAKEENATTRLYIDKMAELATPNYTPLYIFGGLGIIGFIIIYSVNVYKDIQTTKIQLLLGNSQPNTYKVLPSRKIPQRIQDKADEVDGYVEYTDGVWYVYDDNDELISKFTPKNKQLTDKNRY
jgi:hypothetical protein